jgi:endonuclease/exonuclease/phosphatase family metal-dependent hydrolase
MKKRLSFFTLILFLFVSLFINSVNVSAEDKGHKVPLRVMSYNIHYGSGFDNVYDIQRLADVMRESGADIIGLQEVDVHWGSRTNFDDDIKILAEKLDMNYFFAPIYDMDPYNPGESRRQFGVAVLSKYPIISAVNEEITRLSTQSANPEPALAPGFAHVLINVKGVHVPVYVTHLDYRSDPKVRILQVADMLNVMSQDHREKILMGDMNAAPKAPELAPLFTNFNDILALPDPSRGTTSNNYTFPANKPNERIDYILTSDGIKTESYEVINTLASDHRPVVADLILERGRQN